MRKLALAAAIGIGLTLGGVASAEQWTDPNGRLVVNLPAGWRTQPQNAGGTTALLAFNASNDCFFFGIPNPATANSSARAAHSSTAPLDAAAWASAVNVIADFFPNNSAQLVSSSVDTSGFWPVQRAELRGPEKTVFATIQVRPGVELRAFCSGASSADAYAAIFASLSHPNDAAWQAQAEQAAAAPAAQAEQPAAEPQQQERRRRGRGLTTGENNDAAGSGM